MKGRFDLFSDDARSRLSGASDEHLITEIVAGRHDALTALFDRYGRLIFAIAMRILQDQGEAEEIVQTVLLDIFRHAAKFDPARGTAKMWLIQYAYHGSLQRRRHLESRRFYDSEQFESVVNEIVKHSPRRSFGLSVQETSRLIREALGLLKYQQREAIEMIFFEGLTPEEIAERTGSSVTVVRHNLYRGLDKLRGHLDLHRLPRQLPNKKELRFRGGGIVDVRA